MKLLAFDTSTELCSCALYLDGQISHRSLLTPQRHTQFILGLMEELLATAELNLSQLDGLAVGQGPGSFTGLRIACGIAQGLALANNLPVAMVSTLAMLAQKAYETHQVTQVLSAIDARIGEVYWGSYHLNSRNIMEKQDVEMVCSPEQVTLPTTGHWYGVGSGWDRYGTLLTQRLGPLLNGHQLGQYPDSTALLSLALDQFANQHWVTAEQVLPVYLRNKVV